MKIIKIRPITEKYQCSFCKRKYFIRKACEKHENKCYYNPNRNCLTCDNTGTLFFNALGSNLGVIPDAESRDCDSCIIAGKVGGKSYIEE